MADVLLTDIRNWVRAAAYPLVKKSLEEALPDAKLRTAYQLFDGEHTIEQIRTKCKMSPNAVGLLGSKCVAMGLMEIKEDKRRVRLFDLNDFGMLDDDGDGEAKGNGRNKKAKD
ncbi:MAG TPA: hypothetical protein VHN77_15665 [Phycisphaerales bacterium]|nr:hypothetical protein [Phycisphaerales bacterium]